MQTSRFTFHYFSHNNSGRAVAFANVHSATRLGKEQSVVSDKKWGIYAGAAFCSGIFGSLYWFCCNSALFLLLIVMFWKHCGFKQFVEGHYRWKWLLRQNACRIIWFKFIWTEFPMWLIQLLSFYNNFQIVLTTKSKYG